MQTLKLDTRLSLVASFVRNGSRVADIGTDHAYIPVYLLQNGLSPFALAADLREMPLENAAKTIEKYALGDRIKTVLSDGLEKIQPNSCDDIIIAGMGGLLIAQLLSKAAWLKNEKYRLVLQPMSHQEDVRRFLYENGFDIVREGCCCDERHCYCVIAAQYSGRAVAFTPAMPYTGTLWKSSDPAARLYLEKQLSRLVKRRDALRNATPDASEVGELSAIIDDFRRLQNDNS